ncbi:unnamed protein product, partial [Amoebophrya sp. A120]
CDEIFHEDNFITRATILYRRNCNWRDSKLKRLQVLSSSKLGTRTFSAFYLKFDGLRYHISTSSLPPLFESLGSKTKSAIQHLRAPLPSQIGFGRIVRQHLRRRTGSG